MRQIFCFLFLFLPSFKFDGVSAIAEIENGLVEKRWGMESKPNPRVASLHREAPIKEEAGCCRLTGDVDIVILLDGSSSVGLKNFMIMQTFIVNIISALNIGVDTAKVNRFALQSFGIFGAKVRGGSRRIAS